MFPAKQSFNSVQLSVRIDLRLIEILHLAASYRVFQIKGKRFGIIVIRIFGAEKYGKDAAFFTVSHILFHTQYNPLEFSGFFFLAPPDKRDINQNPNQQIDKLQKASGNGTGRLVAAKKKRNRPVYGLAYNRYKSGGSGKKADKGQDNGRQDKRGRHSEIENNRETEHGDFTDIENSGGQRNICDFPVMAFT